MKHDIWIVPGTMMRVVDGDTVWIRLDLGWRVFMEAPVRLAGINAPEVPTPEGEAAKAYLEDLLPAGKAVSVVSHSLDKYGRCLARLQDPNAPGVSYNQRMIDSGHAVPA